MTDNEIIKALECCKVGSVCTTCPLFECKSGNCISQLNAEALDLIKQQRAKVEELSEILSDHIRMEYAKIRAEAITEFAERLKEVFTSIDGMFECWEIEGYIENLAKEILEATDE